jgi:DNA-binding beta-propeller fold protein YncE
MSSGTQPSTAKVHVPEDAYQIAANQPSNSVYNINYVKNTFSVINGTANTVAPSVPGRGAPPGPAPATVRTGSRLTP